MVLNRWLTTGLALLTLAAPFALHAQTMDALKADANTPGDILTYGMGYSNQRYSALADQHPDRRQPDASLELQPEQPAGPGVAAHRV